MKPSHIFALALASCSFTDTPSPGLPDGPALPLGPVEAFISGDLDGDGIDELMHVVDATLHTPNGPFPVKGRVVAQSTGRLTGDKTDTIVFAMGRSRSHRDAPTSLYVLDASGLKTIAVPKAEMSRVTDLQVSTLGVFVTVLGPQKKANSYAVEKERLVPVLSSIMGLQQKKLNAKGTTAVGRLYGDEPRTHGSLEIIDALGTKRTVPTVRGVRSLTIADLNHDGINDLLVGDAWHYQYGEKAEARLAAYIGPNFDTRIDIGTIEDSYTVNQIFHFGEAPNNRVLAIGSSSAVVFQQTDLGWISTVVSQMDPRSQADVWTQNTATGPNHWLLISGNPAIKVPITP